MQLQNKHYLIAAGVVLALILVYFATRGEPEPAVAPVAPRAVVPAAPAPVPAPKPEEVTGVTLSRPGGGEPLVSLSRDGEAWKLDSLKAIPANVEKTASFVSSLLTAPREAVNEDPAKVGLAPGEGVEVKLQAKEGTKAPDYTVGLRPQNQFDAAYVKQAGDDKVYLVHSDLRGDMGLVLNLPNELPDSRAWLPERALSFDPSQAAGLVATYPDKRMVFVNAGDNGWRMEGAVPPSLGELNTKAVSDWVAALSDFKTDGRVPEPAQTAQITDKPDFTIDISMKDGSALYLKSQPDKAGKGYWVETSAHPDLAYLLPAWRFTSYFERDRELFPAAVPTFSPDDVRMVDILRDGESLKFRRQDGRWQVAAMPYQARSERIDALVKQLAGWRPVSIASRDFPPATAVHGGPVVDLIMADGGVIQYRLAGKHPNQARRYVLVNGDYALTATDTDAAEMFPAIAEVLNLGTIFPASVGGGMTRLQLASAEGKPIFSLSKGEDGVWTAATGQGKAALAGAEQEELLTRPLKWEAAGLSPVPPSSFTNVKGALRLTIASPQGDARLDILPEQDGYYPALLNGRDAKLLAKKDLGGWLASMRKVNDRIKVEAAAATTAAK